jgi:flagellar basal body-associated protein FliL
MPERQENWLIILFLSLTAVLAAMGMLALAWTGASVSSTAQAGKASSQQKPPPPFDRLISKNTETMIEQGRHVFRYDTFGDEAFWGDAIKLHQAWAASVRG